MKAQRVPEVKPPEVKPITLPHGQKWFLEKHTQLGTWRDEKGVTHPGYLGDEGMCFGIAHEGMLAYIGDEMSSFERRYSLLAEIDKESLLTEVQAVRTQIKTWRNEAGQTLDKKFNEEWTEKKAEILKQDEKDKERQAKQLDQANRLHQKAHNAAIQKFIDEKKKTHFAGADDKRIRFDTLSELNASAETIEIHQLIYRFPHLFSDEPDIYLMDSLPKEDALRNFNHAYIFTKIPSLKFYQIKDHKEIELKITEDKEISKILDIKGIDPERPLQQQLKADEVSSLLKRVEKKRKPFAQDSASSLRLLMSKKLEDQQGLVRAESFCGIYTLEELTNYFKTLQEQITSPLNNRVGIMLRSAEHAIFVGYDPKDKTWTLINANQLPKKEKKGNDEIAKEVMSALFCTGVVAFSSEIYVRKIDKEKYQPSFSQWKETASWKAMHSFQNPQKINAQDTRGVSWIYSAAKHGHTEIVTALLERGANANLATKDDGTTPLNIAAERGNTQIVNALLKNGANPNLARKDGIAPLHIVAQVGDTEIVNALLKNGANENLAYKEKGGITPLYIAAQEGHYECVDLLARNKNTINRGILADTKVLIDAAQNKNCRFSVETLLKKHHKNVIPEKLPGFTPLHAAVFFGHPESVAILLKRGADVTKKAGGISVLSFAVAMGNSKILQLVVSALFQKLRDDIQRVVDPNKMQAIQMINKAAGDFATTDQKDWVSTMSEVVKTFQASNAHFKKCYKDAHSVYSFFGRENPLCEKIQPIVDMMADVKDMKLEPPVTIATPLK